MDRRRDQLVLSGHRDSSGGDSSRCSRARCEGMRLLEMGGLRGDSLAYLSRVDIAHHAWREVRLARRRYLEMVLPGTSTRIFGVHLAAIHSNVTERRREHELKSLLANIAQHQHGFHVVTGDFNTLAPGEQLDMARLPSALSRSRVDHRTQDPMENNSIAPRRRLHRRLPALSQTDAGHTFPTWDPHVRLDYVFVPKEFADRLTQL